MHVGLDFHFVTRYLKTIGNNDIPPSKASVDAFEDTGILRAFLKGRTTCLTTFFTDLKAFLEARVVLEVTEESEGEEGKESGDEEREERATRSLPMVTIDWGCGSGI
jgi:hypothetical protein